MKSQQPPPPPPPSKKMKIGPSPLGTSSSSTEKEIRVLLLGNEGRNLTELHILLLEKGFKVTVFTCPTHAFAFFGMEFPAELDGPRYSCDPVVFDRVCDDCLSPFPKCQTYEAHKSRTKACRGKTVQTVHFDATSEEKIVETGYKAVEKVAMHSKKMKCGVDMIIVNELVLAKHATGKPPVTAVDIVGAMRESSMNLPVVVVTDSNDDEALARCLAGGVTEVIKKPITGDQVVDLKKYLQE